MEGTSSFSSLSSLTSCSDLEAEEEAGSSSGRESPPCDHYQRRRRSYRANIGAHALGSPRPGLAALLYDEPCHDRAPPHFLDSCFLCKRRIGRHRDIFMYRGDIPFCSEECRQEQIEKDEEEEKMRSLSLRVKSTTLKQKSKQKKGSSTGPSEPQKNKIHLRTDTVTVAG